MQSQQTQQAARVAKIAADQTKFDAIAKKYQANSFVTELVDATNNLQLPAENKNDKTLLQPFMRNTIINMENAKTEIEMEQYKANVQNAMKLVDLKPEDKKAYLAHVDNFVKLRTPYLTTKFDERIARNKTMAKQGGVALASAVTGVIPGVGAATTAASGVLKGATAASTLKDEAALVHNKKMDNKLSTGEAVIETAKAKSVKYAAGAAVSATSAGISLATAVGSAVASKIVWPLGAAIAAANIGRGIRNIYNTYSGHEAWERQISERAMDNQSEFLILSKQIENSKELAMSAEGAQNIAALKKENEQSLSEIDIVRGRVLGCINETLLNLADVKAKYNTLNESKSYRGFEEHVKLFDGKKYTVPTSKNPLQRCLDSIAKLEKQLQIIEQMKDKLSGEKLQAAYLAQVQKFEVENQAIRGHLQSYEFKNDIKSQPDRASFVALEVQTAVREPLQQQQWSAVSVPASRAQSKAEAIARAELKATPAEIDKPDESRPSSPTASATSSAASSRSSSPEPSDTDDEVVVTRARSPHSH